MPLHRRMPTARKSFALVQPEISHLQALLLFRLSSGEQRGKVLREALQREDMLRSLPTFHTCMNRLVEDKFVTRTFVDPAKGSRGRESVYKLTETGRAALKELRAFYRRMERQARRRR